MLGTLLCSCSCAKHRNCGQEGLGGEALAATITAVMTVAGNVCDIKPAIRILVCSS